MSEPRDPRTSGEEASEEREFALELRRSTRIAGLLVPCWGLLAGLALSRLVEEAGLRDGRLPPGAYLVVGFSTVLLGLILVLRTLATREYLRVDQSGIRLPGSLWPWKIRTLSYDYITSYARFGPGRTGRVVIAWKGVFSVQAFGRAAFVEPDAVDRLDAALVAGLARHPEREEVLFRGALASRFRRAPRLCLAMALLLVLVFFWQRSEAGGDMAVDLLRSGALSPWLTLHQGEWYRVATATLHHAGWLHIAANLFGLLILGVVLEPVLGRWRLLLVMIVAGVAANLLSAIASSSFASVGFSGAILGMLGCFLVLRLRFRSLSPTGRKAELYLVLMVALSMLSDWLSMPGVDHFGHLGGLIAGVILGSLLGNEDELRDGVHRPSRVLVAVVVLASALWGLAAARAVHYRETHDLARLVRELVENPDPGTGSRKLDYATVLAFATLRDREADVAELALASEVLSAAVEHSPASADSLAVLAGVEYVLGNPRGAAEAGREALAIAREEADAEFIAELSLYEWWSDSAPAGVRGPADAGAIAALAPTVVDDAPATGDVLTLSSPIAHPKGLLAHVLVLEGEELRGFLWLRFGPFRAGQRHFAEGWSEFRAGRELSYRVTYFSKLDERLPRGAWQWRYWPWDPEAVQFVEERAASLRSSSESL